MAAAGDRATGAGVEIAARELFGCLGVADRPVAADRAIEVVG